MNTRIIISLLLLVAAALAFTSLSYVPVTVLQTTMESKATSYYAYAETFTTNYCCSAIYVTLPKPTSILVPFVTNYTITPIPTTVTYSGASLTTYIIPQTLTTHVPASEALGLSSGVFNLLAVAVIGVLAVVTVWIILKSRTGAGRRGRNPC